VITWIIPAGLGIIALAVTLIVIGRRTATPLSAPRAAYVGGIISAAVIGVVTIVTTVITLAASAIAVTLPVGTYWPSLPSGVTITDGPTAHVTAGGFRTAEVTVTGLDFAARVWLAGGILIQGATFVIVSVAVAVLFRQLLNNDPFRPVVARALTVSGIAVAVGGIGWQALSLVGGFMASHQVLEVTGWTSTNPSATSLEDFGWPPMSTSFGIEGWPLPVGLALVALAFVIRRGAALQRDTEGLV